MQKISFMVKTFEGGGAQRVIHTLAQYYVSVGVEVHIITMYHAESYELSKGMYMFNMNIDRADTSVIHNFEKLELVINYFRESQIDSLIVCSTSAPMYEYALNIKKIIPIKIISAMTNAPDRSPVREEDRIRRNQVFDLLCKANAGFVFQNEYEQVYFSKDIQKRSILIDNPLMEGLPEPHNGPTMPVIVSAGRYDEQKNFELLIMAFAQFSKINPQYELHIYGRGHMETVYRELIQKLQMESKIKLLPFSTNIHNIINNSEMFVQSSNYEGVSNILLEVLSMGIPVVSTDCPAYGAKDFIINNVNGVLVPPNDETKLLSAMLDISEKSIDFRRRAQIEAERIRARLDVRRIAPIYLEFLKQLNDESEV